MMMSHEGTVGAQMHYTNPVMTETSTSSQADREGYVERNEVTEGVHTSSSGIGPFANDMGATDYQSTSGMFGQQPQASRYKTVTVCANGVTRNVMVPMDSILFPGNSGNNVITLFPNSDSKAEVIVSGETTMTKSGQSNNVAQPRECGIKGDQTSDSLIALHQIPSDKSCVKQDWMMPSPVEGVHNSQFDIKNTCLKFGHVFNSSIKQTSLPLTKSDGRKYSTEDRYTILTSKNTASKNAAKVYSKDKLNMHTNCGRKMGVPVKARRASPFDFHISRKRCIGPRVINPTVQPYCALVSPSEKPKQFQSSISLDLSVDTFRTGFRKTYESRRQKSAISSDKIKDLAAVSQTRSEDVSFVSDVCTEADNRDPDDSVTINITPNNDNDKKCAVSSAANDKDENFDTSLSGNDEDENLDTSLKGMTPVATYQNMSCPPRATKDKSIAEKRMQIEDNSQMFLQKPAIEESPFCCFEQCDRLAQLARDYKLKMCSVVLERCDNSNTSCHSRPPLQGDVDRERNPRMKTCSVLLEYLPIWSQTKLQKQKYLHIGLYERQKRRRQKTSLYCPTIKRHSHKAKFLNNATRRKIIKPTGSTSARLKQANMYQTKRFSIRKRFLTNLQPHTRESVGWNAQSVTSSVTINVGLSDKIISQADEDVLLIHTNDGVKYVVPFTADEKKNKKQSNSLNLHIEGNSKIPKILHDLQRQGGVKSIRMSLKTDEGKSNKATKEPGSLPTLNALSSSSTYLTHTRNFSSDREITPNPAEVVSPGPQLSTHSCQKQMTPIDPILPTAMPYEEHHKKVLDIGAHESKVFHEQEFKSREPHKPMAHADTFDNFEKQPSLEVSTGLISSKYGSASSLDMNKPKIKAHKRRGKTETTTLTNGALDSNSSPLMTYSTNGKMIPRYEQSSSMDLSKLYLVSPMADNPKPCQTAQVSHACNGKSVFHVSGSQDTTSLIDLTKESGNELMESTDWKETQNLKMLPSHHSVYVEKEQEQEQLKFGSEVFPYSPAMAKLRGTVGKGSHLAINRPSMSTSTYGPSSLVQCAIPTIPNPVPMLQAPNQLAPSHVPVDSYLLPRKGLKVGPRLDVLEKWEEELLDKDSVPISIPKADRIKLLKESMAHTQCKLEKLRLRRQGTDSVLKTFDTC